MGWQRLGWCMLACLDKWNRRAGTIAVIGRKRQIKYKLEICPKTTSLCSEMLSWMICWIWFNRDTQDVGSCKVVDFDPWGRLFAQLVGMEGINDLPWNQKQRQWIKKTTWHAKLYSICCVKPFSCSSLFQSSNPTFGAYFIKYTGWDHQPDIMHDMLCMLSVQWNGKYLAWRLRRPSLPCSSVGTCSKYLAEKRNPKKLCSMSQRWPRHKLCLQLLLQQLHQQLHRQLHRQLHHQMHHQMHQWHKQIHRTGVLSSWSQLVYQVPMSC